MKLFLFLFLLIVSIEYIQSRKNQLLRTYIIKQDNPVLNKKLSVNYTVYDSTEKKSLCKLKLTSTGINTLTAVRQPENDMVGKMKGEWVEKVSNLTLSIFDKTLNKWIDGIIRMDTKRNLGKYTVLWNGQSFNTKKTFWRGSMEINDNRSKDLLAKSRRHIAWVGNENIKYELRIYSNQYPDMLYICLQTLDDHRDEVTPE